MQTTKLQDSQSSCSKGSESFQNVNNPQQTRCAKCSTFYTYNEDTKVSVCYSRCPKGYAGDLTTMECLPEKSCKALFNGLCLESCPFQYKYMNDTTCLSSCPKLSNGTQCVNECSENDVIYKSTCVAKCPSGYWTNGKNCERLIVDDNTYKTTVLPNT